MLHVAKKTYLIQTKMTLTWNIMMIIEGIIGNAYNYYLEFQLKRNKNYQEQQIHSVTFLYLLFFKFLYVSVFFSRCAVKAKRIYIHV